MSTGAIRQATPRDLARNPSLRALLALGGTGAGTFPGAPSEGLGDLELLVAGDAEDQVWALAAYRRLDAYAVEIEHLAVAPPRRHAGLATALVHRIRQDAEAMVVARADAPSRRFFRAAGFSCSDPVPGARQSAPGRSLCVLPHPPLLRDPQAAAGPPEWIHGPPVPAPVLVLPPSGGWPRDFAALAGAIGHAVGPGALAIEHVGSTSVPGLPAKPVIDVVLTVGDPDCEEEYVPQLERAGFVFRLREPAWYRHRLLVPGPGSGLPAANVHVLPPGSPETARMTAFRDWLRTHGAERAAYARAKADAAAETNARGAGSGLVMDYNRAKEPFIRALYARIHQT